MTETLAVWCCSSCGAVYHEDYPRCPADGAEVVLALEDPLIGKQVGHYVVDELIGEGGMGRVYAAHHAHLRDKRYAIKVLLGDFASTTTMRQRFTNEAESASRLSHPNLVNVTDLGTMPGGLPYIVMEFVSGKSLGALIDEGPMDAARVIRLARGICAGLAHAHAGGVVHRDLKPDNILVVGTGEAEVPRIADFGLAVTTDPNDARLTTTGMAVGTPAYCAPEQMAGRRVDGRADLYGLGMTMFEMLTGGTLPFDGAPLEVMTAKAHGEARTVRELAPAIVVPPDLQSLISKLLRRSADDRPESADAVITALDATRLTDIPAVAPPQPVAITETMQRRKGGRGLLYATLALLVAGGVVVVVATRPHDTAAAPPPAPTPVAAVEPPAATPPPPPPAPTIETLDSPPPTIMRLEPARAIVSHEALPPPAPPARQPTHQRSHHHPTREARVATEPVPKAIVPDAVVVPPPPPPPPPAAPVQLVARLAGVDVSGSLPSAVVRRAVERIVPAVQRCAPTGAPLTAQVTFAIDESRRPVNLRVARATGALASCIAGAFAAVRTEAAPDVGDAEVTVQLAFQAPP